jgi:hypothetical protein
MVPQRSGSRTKREYYSVALAPVATSAYLPHMDPKQAIGLLREHETELRAGGVESVSIFGSVARGEASEGSDVDVVVRLGPNAPQTGFAYFGFLEELTEHFQQILGESVDVVVEPVRKARLRREIEREAALAF